MKQAGQVVIFRFPKTDLEEENFALPCYWENCLGSMTIG